MLQLNNQARRKKRQTVSLQIIKNIRRRYERNISSKEIARDEDVTVQTVNKITRKIADGYTDDQIVSKSYGRKSIVDSPLRSKLSQILLKDASYSQDEIKQELSMNNINVSQSCISRNLKKMRYSRKRLVRVPEERNSQKTLCIRQTYARGVSFISDGDMIFLDETGVNLHQSRTYGYSPINEKAYRTVKCSRGQNISCMVAIKKSGILGFKILDGAYNGMAFMEFIQEVLIPHFRIFNNDLLVMDNCSFHRRKDVVELLNANNINHRFLPPYSPQLNPIEEYFSHFKAHLNSFHPAIRDRNLMKERIREILDNENVDFAGWFLNMRRYVEKALARHEFI